MIEKVRHYLTDVLLLAYLVQMVYGVMPSSNVYLLISCATACFYTITQHKEQLFSDIIKWGMCLTNALIWYFGKIYRNAISSIKSHLEAEDAELCSWHLAMATDKVQSLSKTTRKRSDATLKLCDHDLARA